MTSSKPSEDWLDKILIGSGDKGQVAFEQAKAAILQHEHQAVIDELENLLPEFVHILPNGINMYVSSIMAEDVIKKCLARLEAEGKE